MRFRELKKGLLLFAALSFAANGWAQIGRAQTPVKQGLDTLHVSGKYIRDSANRVVILRGVTTLTRDNNGQPMVMGAADYARIHAWGFNTQQIRLEGCPLGLIPPCRADSSYLDKVAELVELAAQHGIYSIFKATLYDIPGYSFRAAFTPSTWDAFWSPASGIQDTYVHAWETVWKRFAGNAAVIGYDVLNEPVSASNTPDFSRRYLFPFYRKAIAALHAVDPQRIFFYQPDEKHPEEGERLGVDNAVFSPHFYPPPREDISAALDKRVRSGGASDVPVLIGEYGYPNTNFGNLPAATPERDMQDAMLFDRFDLGTIKTWYTSHGEFAMLRPDGRANARIKIFSRPYPLRIAGTPQHWSFDFSSRTLTLQYQPDPSIQAPTMICVQKHVYPDGFDASSSDGEHFTTNGRDAGTGSRAFSYDDPSQALVISSPSQGMSVRTITIKPR